LQEWLCSRIIFDSRRDELREGIYSKAANGSGKIEQIFKMPDTDMWPASILKDGNILFFVQNFDLQDITYDIGMLSIYGDCTSKLLLKETYDAALKISSRGSNICITIPCT
jgi:hypothetical protein